jgi:hypothetical protein
MKDSYDLDLLKSKLTKKKKINSRSKGNTFERKICSLFNDRFNTTEFSRTPGSGAFATTHNLPDYLKVYGDIITPKNFKYIIECKKGYNKSNINSLFNKSSEIWDFINKAEIDSSRSKKDFIIIFQQDRQPAITITKKNILPKLLHTIEFDTYQINILDDILKLDDATFISYIEHLQ